MAILDEIEQVTAACDSQDDDTKTSKADGSAAKSSVNTTASDNEGVISTSAMYKSNELKDAGNEAMKQSQFDKAVQLYTQALELNICNAAARCNRSQAYLKLQRYIEAEADASAVLHEAMNNSNIRSTSEAPPAKSQARVLSELVKSDPMLTKALYRRGLARVNLDSKHWYGALDDFIALVIIDENNKVFIKERDRVAAMISQQRSKNTSKPSSERDLTVKPDVTSSRHKDAANVSVSSSQGLSKDKTAVKSSTETDLIGMKAVSTTRSKKVPSPSQLADGDSTSHNRHIDVSGDRNLTATTTPATSISSSPTNQSNEKKSLVKSNAGKSAKVINPEVPTEAPKTVYELERIWRGLKSNPERFAQYLSLFKKSTCKKVSLMDIPYRV
jgi:tetratricopeptide (TPR) repeat protein